jgi:CRISPR-associated endoribonuclease Cas6
VKFSLEIQKNCKLPYWKGSMVRGITGRWLKRVVCTFPDFIECSPCILISNCFFPAMFGGSNTKSLTNENFGNNLINNINYIISCNDDRIEFKKYDTLSFNLKCFSQPNQLFPLLLASWRMAASEGFLGQKGDFKLLSVTDDSGNLLFTFDDSKFKIPDLIKYSLCFETNKQMVDKITLKFITPFRTKVDNSLTSSIKFTNVITSIVRRLEILTGKKLIISELIDASRNIIETSSNLYWRDQTRYSNRQHQKMKFGGIIGEVSFSGKLTPFLPLLKLAEIIHIGKQASFGLGQIKIISSL